MTLEETIASWRMTGMALHMPIVVFEGMIADLKAVAKRARAEARREALEEAERRGQRYCDRLERHEDYCASTAEMIVAEIRAIPRWAGVTPFGGGKDSLLGQSAPCRACGQPGTYQVNPYDLDVNDKTVIEPLCEKCSQQCSDDI